LQDKGSQAGTWEPAKPVKAQNAVIPAGIAGIQTPWMARNSNIADILVRVTIFDKILSLPKFL